MSRSPLSFVFGSGAAALVAAAAVTALLLGGGASPAQAQAQGLCGERTVGLEAGWNLAAWTGSTMTIAAATADIAGDFDAILAWDSDAQEFRSYRVGVPLALNTLTVLEPYEAFWIHATVGVRTVWTQPVSPNDGRVAEIGDGWTLVAWSGPDNTEPTDAFSPQAFGGETIVQSQFDSAYSYSPGAGRFFTYSAFLPEALNDLGPLFFGEAIWIRTVAPGQFQIPAPSETGCPEPLPTLPLDPDAAARHDRLAQVDSWLYQLQGPDGAPLDLPSLDARDAGLLVIDYSRDGSGPGAFSPAEIAAAQAQGAIVLAYLSIGEAEDWRYYFDPAWVRDGEPTPAAPPWLAEENPDWPGAYAVQFWEPDWQAIILGPGGYLDRILAAGFDGVYLDKIDEWEYWWDSDSGLPPLPADDMARFVIDLARHVREDLGRPGFLIVPQNAPDILEALHEDQQIDYLSAVDAIGAEDTFYFGDADEDNPLDVQDYALAYLRRFRDAGKPVFAVDYLLDPAKQADFYARARAEGFVPLVAPRALDRVLPQPG